MGTSREPAGVTSGAGTGPRAGTHIPLGTQSEVLAGSSMGQGPSGTQRDQVRDPRHLAEGEAPASVGMGENVSEEAPGFSLHPGTPGLALGSLERETPWNTHLGNPRVGLTLHFPRHSGVPAREGPRVVFQRHVHMSCIFTILLHHPPSPPSSQEAGVPEAPILPTTVLLLPPFP